MHIEAPVLPLVIRAAEVAPKCLRRSRTMQKKIRVSTMAIASKKSKIKEKKEIQGKTRNSNTVSKKSDSISS